MAIYRFKEGVTPKQMPFYSEGVSAGFPSPADDYQTQNLDINDILVSNPMATYYIRVKGDSMIGASIFPDDILVVDRSLNASSGDIIVAYLNGEFTVKRLKKSKYTIELYPENDNYPVIWINESDDFRLWGVVKFCIHKLRK